MSAGLAGYKAMVYFSTSTSGALAKIAELRNFTIRQTHAPINATSHDSSGDRELIAGTGSWAGSADGIYASTNATQQNMQDILQTRVKVNLEAYPKGTSSGGYWGGEVFVTDFEMSAPNEDAAAYNISFEGHGALTSTST